MNIRKVIATITMSVALIAPLAACGSQSTETQSKSDAPSWGVKYEGKFGSSAEGRIVLDSNIDLPPSCERAKEAVDEGSTNTSLLPRDIAWQKVPLDDGSTATFIITDDAAVCSYDTYLFAEVPSSTEELYMQVLEMDGDVVVGADNSNIDNKTIVGTRIVLTPGEEYAVVLSHGSAIDRPVAYYQWVQPARPQS